jgi:hypothetical protein
VRRPIEPARAPLAALLRSAPTDGPLVALNRF